MLMIRLQRVGRRNHAEFRVVVTEHTRAPKSADYVELVGNYNPHKNTVSLNAERIKYWISKGAQVSDTMHNILVSEKVIKGKKKNVLPKKSPIVKEEEGKGESKEADESTTEEAASKATGNKKETKDEPTQEEVKEKEETPAPEEKNEETKDKKE